MYLEHRLSALLQLHLHYLLNSWLQWIGQRQLQDQMRNIEVLEFGVTYIRYFTVFDLANQHNGLLIIMSETGLFARPTDT